MIGFLSIDPIRMPHWEIARVTDWQIVNNIVVPMSQREEEYERGRKGLPPAGGDESPDDPGPEFVPNKTFMVNTLMGLGMSKQQALAEYEAQAKLNAK